MRFNRKRQKTRPLTILLAVAMAVSAVSAVYFGTAALSKKPEKKSSMADDLISAIDTGGIDKDEYGNMVKFFDSLSKEQSFEYKDKYKNLYVDNDFKFKDPQKKTAYLTFDDGPDETVTPQVLDILKKYGIKGTFFTIHNGSKKADQLYKRIVNEGHTIAAHSYTHDYEQIYQSVDSFLEDFSKISDHIEKVTGVKPELFRFPGGSINYFNAGVYRQIIGEMIRRGYVYYDWNVSAEDAVRAGVSAGDIKRYALAGSSNMNKKIVLMHDGAGHKNTAEALPGIIEGLKAQGYEFAPLTKDVMPVVFS